MSKDDYVIICGDFGGIWNLGVESNSEKYWLDWFNSRSYTLLFIDGNHENFDRLNKYPVKEWHGGSVHIIRPSVLHMMRGQVFELSGKKFFTFGGASSHDISGGILELNNPKFREKRRALKKISEPYRINHLSWWENELATEEEMEIGRKNLSRHNYTVDYIVTHCCSTSTQVEIAKRGRDKSDRQTEYFEELKCCMRYDKWFFGHYHTNMEISEKEIILYNHMIKIQ